MIIKTLKRIFRPIAVPPINWFYNLLGKYYPRKLISIKFRSIYHRDMDWEHPLTLDEKINWQKIYSDTSHWTKLADKYLVRQFVAQRGLEDMLVKLYGRWEKAEQIDWQSLPQQFVMKANNGSGDILICSDKSKLNTDLETKKFKKVLHTRFGYKMAELHYNNIPPCIIAEELLDVRKQPINSSSLIDYKIWAFNGKPAYIWACYDRDVHSVQVGVYDLDWNFHPEYSVETDHYRIAKKQLPRPVALDKMLEAASILSKGFPQVRVDLYEVDGKAYFGELTFTSNAGFNNFYTEEFLRELGSQVILNV